MADNLRIFGNTYNNAVGVKMTDTNGNEVTYEKAGETVPEPEPLDVDFIDYDGTLLYTYTAQEFLNLTALPPNPSHDGLTAQGWNWSLADAKEYVGSYKKLDIGQMYVTDDGKTRIHIYSVTNQDTIIRFQQSVSNGVIVNWGDGSATETYSGTTAANHAHRYSVVGNYTITLEVADGTTLSFPGSSGSTGYSIYGQRGNTAATNAYARASEIVGINIGSNVSSIGDYVFYNCYSLREITIPQDVTITGNYVFAYCSLSGVVIPPNAITTGSGYSLFGTCSSLKRVSLPHEITSIANTMFMYCASLSKITISDSVTSIEQSGFQQCRSLREIIIPPYVTSIGATAFQYCMGIGEYFLLPTTPPTLSATTAFPTDSPGSKVFYVPYSADHSVLNAYKTATNWSTFASYMQEEPQS